MQVYELSVSAELAHFLFDFIVRLVQLEMADLCLNQHVQFIRNSVVRLFYPKPYVVQRFNQLLNYIVLHFLHLNVFFFLTCKIVKIHEFFVYFFDTFF